MKNIITLLSLALCLGIFSFTTLKESNEEQPLIHTVFFWLDEELSEADITEFEAELVKLGTISTIDQYYWGKPAATEDRGVIDNSYSYAINVRFKSIQAHDTYQTHPKHLEFLKQAPKWTKVVVYDNEISH